jgi:hypothetical protein
MAKKISVAYAAQLYGITERGMRDLLIQGKAPGKKVVVGGRGYWDIYASDFDFFLERRIEKRDFRTNKLRAARQELQREIGR